MCRWFNSRWSHHRTNNTPQKGVFLIKKIIKRKKEIITKSIDQNKKEKQLTEDIKTNILENEKVEAFIERVSNINLSDYKEKVMKSKDNVLP